MVNTDSFYIAGLYGPVTGTVAAVSAPLLTVGVGVSQPPQLQVGGELEEQQPRPLRTGHQTALERERQF